MPSFAANPRPDLGNWRAIGDPQRRLERALDELYAYYERTDAAKLVTALVEEAGRSS